jgi:AcrR family transcriptional regulator
MLTKTLAFPFTLSIASAILRFTLELGADMATTRRLGTEKSATRAALMDAVESVMREDGYGALTARRVAEQAGLKHQLVYYYFQTLDDLLIATYERHIGRYLKRIERAFLAERPLHSFWRVHANPVDAVLNMEFLSLANHNEPIRTRTIAFGEDVRRLGLSRLEILFRHSGSGVDALNPFAVTMAISAVGSILGLETAIGISGGHAETRALIEWCIDQLEPDRGR